MLKFPNIHSKSPVQVNFNELVTTVYDLDKHTLPMFNFCSQMTSSPTKDAKTCAIVLDFDDGDATFDGFIDQYKNFKYFIYTTASHTKAKEKFRVVIPLSKWYSYEAVAVYVKSKFNHIDQSTTDRGRRFFWPSKYDADRNISRRYLNTSDAALDMLEDIESIAGLHDFLDASGDNFTRKSNNHADCSKFESVIKYLTTPYPNIRGNGTSASEFFSAVCSCLKFDDNTTLEKVVDKARREHWSDREINHVIKNSYKYIEND